MNFFERHESDDTIHAFHSFWKSGVHYLFTVFAGFHTRHVKAWVKCIEVFGFQLFLDTAEGFTEALEVYDFTCAEEFNGISDFRNIADYAKDIVVGGTCFLFCCKVFEQISDWIAFALKFTCIERNASGSLGPDCYGMVNIVRSKAGIFNLFHGKISGKLMDDSGDHFQVRKFVCTVRIEVVESAHFKALSGRSLNEKSEHYHLHTCFWKFLYKRLSQAILLIHHFVF